MLMDARILAKAIIVKAKFAGAELAMAKQAPGQETERRHRNRPLGRRIERDSPGGPMNDMRERPDPKCTAADVLVETLIAWDVDIVFGLPGDGINGIVEALRTRSDRIRFIVARHEEAAAFMACAYAKWTGKL